MSKITHSHINYCPMSKVNDLGQSRVKSCPSKSIIECENPGPENTCDITSTDHICSNFECQVLHKLDKVSLELEEARSDVAKMKRINTEYRLIMHMPDAVTSQRLIQKGEIDFSGINGVINSHRKSWDSCDDTTLIYNCEFAQRISEAYAQFIHERSSKINLKQVVADKGKEETKNAVKKIETMKIESQEKKAKLSEFGKAVAGYMKIGMKEDAAKAIVKAMGLKE